jgi:hypothetical protein
MEATVVTCDLSSGSVVVDHNVVACSGVDWGVRTEIEIIGLSGMGKQILVWDSVITLILQDVVLTESVFSFARTQANVVTVGSANIITSGTGIFCDDSDLIFDVDPRGTLNVSSGGHCIGPSTDNVCRSLSLASGRYDFSSRDGFGLVTSVGTGGVDEAQAGTRGDDEVIIDWSTSSMSIDGLGFPGILCLTGGQSCLSTSHVRIGTTNVLMTDARTFFGHATVDIPQVSQSVIYLAESEDEGLEVPALHYGALQLPVDVPSPSSLTVDTLVPSSDTPPTTIRAGLTSGHGLLVVLPEGTFKIRISDTDITLCSADGPAFVITGHELFIPVLSPCEATETPGFQMTPNISWSAPAPGSQVMNSRVFWPTALRPTSLTPTEGMGETAAMSQSGTVPPATNTSEDDAPVIWWAYAPLIILGVLCLIGTILGLYYYRRRAIDKATAFPNYKWRWDAGTETVQFISP